MGHMPRKIDLSISEALTEVNTLGELILVTKDHHARNRHTARRCRLQKYILQETADSIVASHERSITKLKCQVEVLMGMLDAVSVPVDRLALERLTMNRFYESYPNDVNEDRQRAWYEEVAMDLPQFTEDALASCLSLEPGVVLSDEGGSSEDPWVTVDLQMGCEEDMSDMFYPGEDGRANFTSV
jgi:hypothetical protein